ncbi:MAG: YbhB/YbcL family Raf kinase inhibitor-like protein [Anaerolineales bacterium]
MKPHFLLALVIAASLLAGCGAPSQPEETQAPAPEETQPPTEEIAATEAPAETESPATGKPAAFTLTSTAFAEGEPIPVQYSCDGADISPPLAWTGVPEGTQSLVLIMDDPDAPIGTWDHWILFNIPANRHELSEDAPIEAPNQDPNAIFVGNNSWGRPGYGGPCPPSGTHRYFFKLYALDATLSLLPGANKKQVEAEMQGHILAETQLMGTYSR